ncbi:protein NO VEIN domain-containing protein [Microbacterium trichothecenolyticum]
MVINNWWDGDTSEQYWMEIRTEPTGFGQYLLAPQRNAAGREEWSYTLTSFVQPGDRIFHWDNRPRHSPAIVGWSEAVGPLETLEWSWQARGTRGRARGVPTEGPAWRMPLTNYVELQQPITRAMLIERSGEIFTLLNEVEEQAGGALYGPFQNRSDGLRAAQGYLTKFPAALVALLFDKPVAPPSLEATSAPLGSRPGSPRAQGYQSDAAKRTALELHAVRRAKAYYWAAGATEVEERGKPYDLRVVIGGVERHVEVKGSVGLGLASVQLTQGEVDHARIFQPTDLFVVDGITASRNDDGSVSTSGGVGRIWSNWSPEDRSLRPTHLRYSLPSGARSVD